ncbi:MAG: DUF2868 domain-containing protein [bacterium]|nr:DUF2868 domain-containing protein [Planctomycetota bacterium]HIL52617.1 DUF2868 domain-containing protein [Planctomycetota bacterium]
MREENLREVLFVRAFEESSRDEPLIDERERRLATREARAELSMDGKTVDPVEFFALRAARLRRVICSAHPFAEGVLEWAGGARLPLWLALVAGLLLGGGIDRLGPHQSVDLLNFPLLLVLVYNLVVYFALAYLALGRREVAGGDGAKSRAAGTGAVARWLLWLMAPTRPWARAIRGDGAAAVASGRFVRDWNRAGARLHQARVACWLHTAAAALMAGAILGMYLRGLVLDYDASWQSTFLSATQVHDFLALLFAPASWILGVRLPDLATIEALRAPGFGDAALWIHFYSVTGALVVLVPRSLLAVWTGRRARSLAKALSFDFNQDAYFMRLSSAERGAGSEATVEAYGYDPSPRASEGLKQLLFDLFGGRLGVTVLEPLDYGAEPASGADRKEGAAHCRVALFSLAQTPEREVHGEYLEELTRAAAGADGREALLVVVDQGPFLERFCRGDEADQRRQSRERNWTAVLAPLDLEPLFCELAGHPDPRVLERAGAVLWPGPLVGATV